MQLITSLHKAIDTVDASGCLYLTQMDNNTQLNHRRNIWQVARLFPFKLLANICGSSFVNIFLT